MPVIEWRRFNPYMWIPRTAMRTSHILSNSERNPPLMQKSLVISNVASQLVRKGRAGYITGGLQLRVLNKSRWECSAMKWIKQALSEKTYSSGSTSYLWQKSGRYGKQYGPELLAQFKIVTKRDFRTGTNPWRGCYCLVKNEWVLQTVTFLIYIQIQTKFRDEVRPRFFGIMAWCVSLLWRMRIPIHMDQSSLDLTTQRYVFKPSVIFWTHWLDYRSSYCR